MNLVEELQWRGMVHDIMPGTEEQLQKELTTGYIGFDPTADSLHVGSLVQIILLMHLQRSGHRPIALVGGATGMVGDPSGKSEERNLLSEEVIRHNAEGVRKQLERFLEFGSGKNAAIMENNINWFGKMGFLEFIRDAGKHITISYMMAKDSVQKRLETGLSFTEFTYQLVQGYDFYHLYKTHGCKLQMGGSDQWGNIVTGTELIRRMGGGEAFAMTTPLITKADGTKFGKTEGGNVWLDKDRTSPYAFYQFWLNVSDEDAKRYIKIFTFLPEEEINALIAEHDTAPHTRVLQKILARELTTMIHSAEDHDAAVETSEILFGRSGTAEALANMNEKMLLSAMEGVPHYELSRSNTENGINIVDLLAVESPVFPSKGEARKMITGGGVSINKEKVSDAELSVTKANLIKNKFLLVQKGKKNYYLLEFK